MGLGNYGNNFQVRHERIKRFYTVLSSILGFIACSLVLPLITNVVLMHRLDLENGIWSEISRESFKFLGPILYAFVLTFLTFFTVLLLVVWLFLTVYFALNSYLNSSGSGSGLDKDLHLYLSILVKRNHTLNPRQDIGHKELSKQAQILTSANMLLDAMFIPLRVLSLSGLYDHDDDDYNTESRATQSDVRALLQRSNDAAIVVILGGPGSGKSTTLRWLTLHMACASSKRLFLLRRRHLARHNLAYSRIPILLYASDYVAYVKEKKDTSFNGFFSYQYSKLYPEYRSVNGQENILVNKLLTKLSKGHCLIMIDGLSEIVDRELYRDFVRNLDSFIINNTASRKMSANRFIITSRQEGYDPGRSLSSQHIVYTLEKLDEEEKKRFLFNWCSAIHADPLQRIHSIFQSSVRESSVMRVRGEAQDLWDAIRVDFQELAANPLMLTLLALLYSGERRERIRPQSVEDKRLLLYRMVTHVLLEKSEEESDKAKEKTEQATLLLGKLAYTLRTGDGILDESEVDQITREVLSNASKKQGKLGYTPKQIHKDDVNELIDHLRSSGLFIKYLDEGQDLFRFPYHPIEDYFVAYHLTKQPDDYIRQDFTRYYRSAAWHEPFVLTVALIDLKFRQQRQRGDFSESTLIETRPLVELVPLQTSNLIQAILDSPDHDGCNAILQLHLLNALSIMLDSRVTSMPKLLQQSIIRKIFDCYGDFLGQGRYTLLQHKIETVTLRWLREMPQQDQDNEQISWQSLPLLEAWHNALCDQKSPIRQEGAVRLLTAIIYDLHPDSQELSLHKGLQPCSKLVWLALVPPLLQLANLRDCSHPFELWGHFSARVEQAQAALPRIEEYAFIALRLLANKYSPAMQLLKDWHNWDGETDRPLFLLAEHSETISYLLTPVILLNSESKAYHDIITHWQKNSKTNTSLQRDLQRQLLHLGETTRYPLAYLFKQLLTHEIDTSSASQDWLMEWDRSLQEEMERGRGATYQQSLILRQSLHASTGGQLESKKRLTEHLLTALADTPPHHEYEKPQDRERVKTYNTLQVQALTVIINIYLLGPQRKRNPQSLRSLQRILRPHYIRNFFDWLDMPVALNTQPYMEEVPPVRTLQKLQTWLDMRVFLSEPQGIMRELYRRLNLENNTIADKHLATLYKLLEQPLNPGSATVLLALYSMILNSAVIPNIQKVRAMIETFEQQAGQQLTREHQMLITAIQSTIKELERKEDILTAPMKNTAVSPSHISNLTNLAMAIHELRRRKRFTRFDIEEVLFKACINDDELPEDLQRRVNAQTLQQIAWEILTNEPIRGFTVTPVSNSGRLSQLQVWAKRIRHLFSTGNMTLRRYSTAAETVRAYPFDLDEEALSRVVDALDNPNSMICFASAQILQQCNRPSEEVRRKIVQKIIQLLRDPLLSSYLLDTPGTLKVWHMDDVLFKTLDMLLV